MRREQHIKLLEEANEVYKNDEYILGSKDGTVAHVRVQWEYEDQLPDITVGMYEKIFDMSKVIGGVRMFPYVEINGVRMYLSN